MEHIRLCYNSVEENTLSRQSQHFASEREYD